MDESILVNKTSASQNCEGEVHLEKLVSIRGHLDCNGSE